VRADRTCNYPLGKVGTITLYVLKLSSDLTDGVRVDLNYQQFISRSDGKFPGRVCGRSHSVQNQKSSHPVRRNDRQQSADSVEKLYFWRRSENCSPYGARSLLGREEVLGKIDVAM